MNQSQTSIRKLHIGGQEPHSDWEILDANEGPHVDHCMDLRDLSFFEDEIFTEIYASHILEHFDYHQDLPMIFDQLNRVLKPAGLLYVSVPDLDKLCHMFIADDLNIEEKYHLMRIFYGGHIDKYDYHMTGLNRELLELYLKISGFINFKIVENFNIFSDTSSYCFKGQPISINIISEKISSDESVENFIEDIFKMAIDFHQNGQLELARLVYLSILNKYPKHADVLHLLGVLTSQEGQYEMATNLIQEAIKINPDASIYYNNLGLSYFHNNKFDEALVATKHSIKLNPDFIDAYFNLGNIFFKSGKFKKALDSYQKVIALDDEHVDAQYNLGSVLLKLEDHKGAIDAFEKTIKLNPKHIDACNNLIYCFNTLGRTEEEKAASEYLEKIKSGT